MNIKTLSLLVGLVLLTMPISQLQAKDAPVLTVQVFHLEHISVREAAVAVESHLSADGSMIMKPASGRLTVQDRAEVVAEIAEVIAAIDRQPIRFRLRIDVLKGGDAEYSVPSLAEVTVRLRRVYPFSSYRRIGTAEFAGEAGDSATLVIGDGYQVQVTVNEQRLDGLPFGLPEKGVRLDVEPFVLQRLLPDKTVREVVRSRAVLSANQEIYIAAGSSEKSASGLVIIVTALAVSEG